MRLRPVIDFDCQRNWSSASNAASCQTCGRNELIENIQIMKLYRYKECINLLIVILLRNVSGKFDEYFFSSMRFITNIIQKFH